jgi:predicted Zn-dependent protease
LSTNVRSGPSPGQESYELGLALLERGHVQEAFKRLSDAAIRDPDAPQIQSTYALALALARREYDRATDIARAAARDHFQDPVLHYNLARIHLAAGRKRAAIKALKGALMVDPDHALTRRELARLGYRRRPVLRFLPRGHALNQALGRLRARLQALRRPQAARVRSRRAATR